MINGYLKVSPSLDEQEIKKIVASFEKQFKQEISFETVTDEKVIGGFVASINGKGYDSSVSLGRIKAAWTDNGKENGKEPIKQQSVLEYLREKLYSTDFSPTVDDCGTVVFCADGVVHIEGLRGVKYGELLEFDGGAFGIALDLSDLNTSAVLLDGASNVFPGLSVKRTDRVADICVGDEVLGRVIDPIGRPLDGRELRCRDFRPIEAAAPAIMDRSPVDTPLETGILAIDSMIPIGRGQRELIIGDRQTGKTSIAISAILNQVESGVICVYCAIGQKASNVANVIHTLDANGVLSHTVVVTAFASDSAAMQYIAPYAACAIAEQFMYQGKDVLIVYDDLSKHAAAYRSMSLLLRRPSGREAYPGDVFYLHSRLLERAARLNKELGGGSITALPIVETLAGDISAYIPTNVISITDGQIYLETELFNAGVRPAVNVGLSVSRVGRSAQSKAMKNVSKNLRLEVAQYRDMAVFAQFGADLDNTTALLLKKGERLIEVLKQTATERFSLAEQTCLLLAATNDIFLEDAVAVVEPKKRALLKYIKKNANAVMNSINATGELQEETKKQLVALMKGFVYNAEEKK